MGIQLFVILSTCIINFGLKSSQLQIQTADQVTTSQVNNGREIQENFQNLFNSIARNNTKNSIIYHGILEQEEAQEKQAFDAMKREILVARVGNSFKKRNFYQESNPTDHIVANKRETKRGGTKKKKEISGNNNGTEDYTKLTKVQLIEKINEKKELCKIYFKRKFDKDVTVTCLTDYMKMTNKELIKKLNEYPILFKEYNFEEEFGPDGKGNGTKTGQ